MSRIRCYPRFGISFYRDPLVDGHFYDRWTITPKDDGEAKLAATIQEQAHLIFREPVFRSKIEVCCCGFYEIENCFSLSTSGIRFMPLSDQALFLARKIIAHVDHLDECSMEALSNGDPGEPHAHPPFFTLRMNVPNPEMSWVIPWEQHKACVTSIAETLERQWGIQEYGIGELEIKVSPVLGTQVGNAPYFNQPELMYAKSDRRVKELTTFILRHAYSMATAFSGLKAATLPI